MSCVGLWICLVIQVEGCEVLCEVVVVGIGVGVVLVVEFGVDMWVYVLFIVDCQ